MSATRKWVIVLALVGLLATCECFKLTDEQRERWARFKESRIKQYINDDDEWTGIVNWLRNSRVAETLASVNRNAFFGETKFSDISQEDFAQRYLSSLVPAINKSVSRHPEGRTAPRSSSALPAKLDWRTKVPAVMTPIKDQGNCGSCWAFASTACIETAVMLANSNLGDLSEQQLVDCTGSYGNEGCGGGWMSNAYDYVKNTGLSTESAYQYTGVARRCKVGAGSVEPQIVSYHELYPQDEGAIMVALQEGLVAVALDATTMQFYNGGIMGPAGCSSLASEVNHAVVIVGYDLFSNPPFWIIRNSWGDDWGENGYAKMQMRVNCCGVTNYPSSVVAAR